MTLQSRTEPTPVEEQTELDDPIKIRWRGDARHRVMTSFETQIEDGNPEAAVAHRCFRRQKSQIVIKTQEERDGLLKELDYLDDPIWWGDGYSTTGRNAVQRVKSELEDSLK